MWGQEKIEYVDQIVKDVGSVDYSEMNVLAQDKDAWIFASNNCQTIDDCPKYITVLIFAKRLSFVDKNLS